MGTLSKILLSNSTGGRPIKVVATSSPGTDIHSTGVSATVLDEIWIMANNTSSVSVSLTIEFGGTTNPDDRIVTIIPPQAGTSIIIPGFTLTGDGSSARTIKAFAGTANVINLIGFINRYEP